MEILFWLAPLFESICVVSGLLCLAFLTFSVICFCEKRGDKLSKKFFVAGICLAILGVLSSPLASAFDTYKTVLIYRGINSTLADKTINTAEKALDVLNMKLDKQLLVEKK